MSAKDPRKALCVRLDPATRAALRRVARARGDKSLAAAARQLLRADLGLTEPPSIGPDRQPTRRPRAERPLDMRLQLEPALRDALGLSGAPLVDAERVRARLTAQLSGLGTGGEVGSGAVDAARGAQDARARGERRE